MLAAALAPRPLRRAQAAAATGPPCTPSQATLPRSLPLPRPTAGPATCRRHCTARTAFRAAARAPARGCTSLHGCSAPIAVQCRKNRPSGRSGGPGTRLPPIPPAPRVLPAALACPCMGPPACARTASAAPGAARRPVFGARCARAAQAAKTPKKRQSWAVLAGPAGAGWTMQLERAPLAAPGLRTTFT